MPPSALHARSPAGGPAFPTPPQGGFHTDDPAQARRTRQEVADVYVLLQRVDGHLDDDGLMERSDTSRDLSLRTAPYVTVEFLKTYLIKKIPSLKEVKPSQISLVLRGTELKPRRTLEDYDQLAESSQDAPTIIGYYVKSLDFKKSSDTGVKQMTRGIQVDRLVPTSSGMRERINEVMQAMAYNIHPRLTDDGTGGTYRMFNIRKTKVLAMFKPKDEEAFAPNNPRGFQKAAGSEGIRPGTYSTGGASREVAAYLLDHDGFAGVPKTAHVHIKHEVFNNPRDEVTGQVQHIWKSGSLQEFIIAHDTAGNMSSRQFSVQQVQRIAMLDLRLINMDRNDGNILVSRSKEKTDDPQERWKLTPIDHGLSLADRLEVAEEDIVWMGWDQVQLPLGQAEKRYIEGLDYRKDAGMLLKNLAIKKNCLRLLWVALLLLKLGARADLTLYEIGKLMYRQDFDEPSRLQGIIEAAVDTAQFYAKRVNLTRGNVHADSKVEGLNLERPKLKPQRTVSKEFKAPSDLTLSPALSASEASELSATPPSSFHLLPSPRDSLDLSDSPSDQTEEWASQSGTGTAIRMNGESTGTAIRCDEGSGTAIRMNGDENTGTEVRMHVEESRPSASRPAFGKRAQPGQMNAKADGGIFSKPDAKGNETLVWDDSMEVVFRQHVEEGIKAEIKKILQRRAA
jgi:hypothetical protein